MIQIESSHFESSVYIRTRILPVRLLCGEWNQNRKSFFFLSNLLHLKTRLLIVRSVCIIRFVDCVRVYLVEVSLFAIIDTFMDGGVP